MCDLLSDQVTAERLVELAMIIGLSELLYGRLRAWEPVNSSGGIPHV